MTTYAPSYAFISNKNYGMLFNQTEIGYIDFSPEKSKSMLFWHAKKI